MRMPFTTRDNKRAASMADAGIQMAEIAAQSGKGRTTIWCYLKQVEKKGLVEKTTTGRIKLSEQVIQEFQRGEAILNLLAERNREIG